MGIRTAQRRLGPVLGLAAFLGLALTFASSPAAAQQWTPEQRAACEPDAMRLCNQRIDTRWGALNADLMRKYAGGLVALEPDVVIPYQSTRP